MLRFLILAALCGWSLGFVVMPPMPDHRIVGGVPTTIAAHPHQASVQVNGDHQCGGSIINASWVVTTASCVYSYTSTYTVSVGSADIYGGKKYSVKRIVRHAQFSAYTIDYDIALLEINGTIQLNTSIKPIRLASFELATNNIVNVTGWGALTLGGANSRQLRQVSVPIIDRKVCADTYSFLTDVTPRMICTEVARGGKGPCHGDAGGPLSANGVLYGLVSWSMGCAAPNYPTVYSNIANLRPWIRSVTGI